jgi:hypothetical protein
MAKNVYFIPKSAILHNQKYFFYKIIAGGANSTTGAVLKIGVAYQRREIQNPQLLPTQVRFSTQQSTLALDVFVVRCVCVCYSCYSSRGRQDHLFFDLKSNQSLDLFLLILDLRSIF